MSNLAKAKHLAVYQSMMDCRSSVGELEIMRCRRLEVCNARHHLFEDHLC